MHEVTGRTFHRNALGTLLTIAGGVQLVRAACLWSNAWGLLALQVVLGTALGTWIARRSYPELRIVDSAVAGGLGAILTVGIGHMTGAAPPLDELAACAVLAVTSAAGVAHACRRRPKTPPGPFVRVVHIGVIVWLATLGTVAASLDAGGDEMAVIGVIVGGFLARLLVPGATAGRVVVGYLGGFVAPVGLLVVIVEGVRHAELMILVVGTVGVAGGVFVAMGAGLAGLVSYRPAFADVDLSPPTARTAR